MKGQAFENPADAIEYIVKMVGEGVMNGARHTVTDEPMPEDHRSAFKAGFQAGMGTMFGLFTGLLANAPEKHRESLLIGMHDACGQFAHVASVYVGTADGDETMAAVDEDDEGASVH